MSYSWDSDEHKEWVRQLASRLRGDGVDVTLDMWATAPGDQLPHFMEMAIRQNDFVIVVCTERYRSRSDSRQGGVGYEGDIMTAEVLTQQNHRKFIPILRSGPWNKSAPAWLAGSYYVDLAGDPYSESNYHVLLSALLGRREEAPPLGQAVRTPVPVEHSGLGNPDPVEQMREAGYAWLVFVSDSVGNQNQHSWGKGRGGDWSHPLNTTLKAGDRVKISAVGASPDGLAPQFQFAVQRSGGSFRVRQDWGEEADWVWEVTDEDIGRHVTVKIAVRRVKTYYQFQDADDYTYATYQVLPSKLGSPQ